MVTYLDVHFVSPTPVHSPSGVGAQKAAPYNAPTATGSVFMKQTSRLNPGECEKCQINPFAWLIVLLGTLQVLLFEATHIRGAERRHSWRVRCAERATNRLPGEGVPAGIPVTNTDPCLGKA